MAKLVFLGGGNMAEAIINALLTSDAMQAIEVIEKNPTRIEYLRQNYSKIKFLDEKVSLSAQDILLIAVKPQDVKAAVADLDLNGALVISIVAGMPIAVLSSYLKGSNRMARVMPNTPAFVASGMAGLYAPAGLSEQDKNLVEQIMRPSGKVIWVDEEAKLHQITAISGSGPAYVFYFMDAVFQAALKLGFSDIDAKLLVKQTFKGALDLATSSNLSFSQLQQNVTSKKGTTFEAISILDQMNVSEIIEQAINACQNRSKEISMEFEEQCKIK